MIEKLQTIMKIPELRKKILFTLGILFICRVGAHIPMPGIDVGALAYYFNQAQNSLFGMFDMFTGGAFQKAAIFSIGIMPYISASIIIQLLGSVFPTISKMMRDEDGRRKITQWTRYGTVVLAAAQGWGVARFLVSMNSDYMQVVPNPTAGFYFMTMLTIATGTIVLMWLGEQITSKGIGNGISLIITIGIIARFPSAVLEEFVQLRNGNRELVVELIIWVGMLGMIAAVILMTQAVRKVFVTYAKRQVAGKTYQNQASYIPLRLNMAGVMPIIFAQSIMFFPTTLAAFLPDDSATKGIIYSLFDYRSFSYMGIYMLVIIFFTYFYTALTFNPDDVANNLKQSNGFIPGVNPGKNTADYIDNIVTRISLPGAIFLGVIAIMTNVIVKIFPGISYNLAAFFGGTSLIIMVGVALDTLAQIESHLMMHHYDGFLKTGKLKGRKG
ncbi:TPA: preprotein translocase subunit SecY [Candidatus Delongbacteria bacterium]|nr:MAG: preprotein translocase subunit SecY [Candidatus Delongbacteria bacterium GWF2_40_14]HAQ61145.1 preprotein translocase subunit SecY [Candidatus Delongbacteria bacterium]